MLSHRQVTFSSLLTSFFLLKKNKQIKNLGLMNSEELVRSSVKLLIQVKDLLKGLRQRLWLESQYFGREMIFGENKVEGVLAATVEC